MNDEGKQAFIDYVNNGMWKYGFNREVSDIDEAIDMYNFLKERNVFNSTVIDRDDI